MDIHIYMYIYIYVYTLYAHAPSQRASSQLARAEPVRQTRFRSPRNESENCKTRRERSVYTIS